MESENEHKRLPNNMSYFGLKEIPVLDFLNFLFCAYSSETFVVIYLPFDFLTFGHTSSALRI